jgi:hypothetical protein
MFLELEGRVELSVSHVSICLIFLQKNCKAQLASADLVQRHERRTGCHVGGFGAWVDAPFGIRVEGCLLDLGCLASCVRAHERRLGPELDLGRGRWAGKPRGTRRQRHGDSDDAIFLTFSESFAGVHRLHHAPSATT